jgi:hypothetical protein
VLREIKSISERVGNIEKILSPSEQKSTYASVVKKPADKAIVITYDGKKSNTVAHKVIEKIDPAKAKVSAFHMLENGKCVLKTKHGDIENIASEIRKIDKKFEVRPLKQRRPRLKVMGRMGSIEEGRTYTDEEIINCIKIQNEFIRTDGEIKIVKREIHNEYDKLIIETDVKDYKEILRAGYLFIGFNRCRVYDATYVPRCYKCSQLSHFEKNCTSMKVCCPKCTGNHRLKDCTSVLLICVNCRRANQIDLFEKKLDENHAAYDRQCPTLAHRRDILRSFFKEDLE